MKSRKALKGLKNEKEFRHGPSDAMNNPPQPLKVGKTLVSKLTEITLIPIDFLTPNSIRLSSHSNHLLRSVVKQGETSPPTMLSRFRMEGTEESEKKFIFSYGIGEAIVEIKDRKMDQGYVVKYGHNKCSITYMFDDNSGDTRIKESQNHEEITNKDEEDHVHKETESMVAKHNKYLEAYFDSIDPKEECSLIKGLEELKWDKNEKEVAVIHGLTEAHEDELKSCYKRAIEMVKCYYDTTMKPWFREEPVKTKMVEDGRDYAKKENPRGCDGLEVGIRNTCQGNKTRFGVNLEDNKTTTVNNEADQEDSASTSGSNDFIVIT
ncbi:hypothetical protein Tco_0788466 [Tanacetum coccineum]